MKKIAFVLSIVLLLLSFSACGEGKGSTGTTEPETQSTQKAEENVVISIRKDLVADETEFLSGISEVKGIKSIADDNFYKLEMSQEAYKNLLTIKSQDVIEKYDNAQKETEYIEDIQHSKDFRRVTVLVDREKYDELDAGTKKIQLITFGALAMSYQMYLEDGQKVYVSAIYSDTKEIAMDVSLPVEM